MVREVRPDDHPDRVASTTRPLSRRATLRHLGGLGVAVAGVAAGLTALEPDTAAATPKQRATRRQPRRGVQKAALKIPPDVVAPDPVVADPGPKPDTSFIATAHLSVQRFRRGWTVRVEVKLHYGEADRAAIQQGGRGRLTCEIWENDDNAVTSVNPALDTFVFAFPGLTVGGNKRGPHVFERYATKRMLDLDRPAPNADELIGLVVLTTPTGQLLARHTNLVKKDFR
jgi:hypothetical protein